MATFSSVIKVNERLILKNFYPYVSKHYKTFSARASRKADQPGQTKSKPELFQEYLTKVHEWKNSESFSDTVINICENLINKNPEWKSIMTEKAVGELYNKILLSTSKSLWDIAHLYNDKVSKSLRDSNAEEIKRTLVKNIAHEIKNFDDSYLDMESSKSAVSDRPPTMMEEFESSLRDTITNTLSQNESEMVLETISSSQPNLGTMADLLNDDADDNASISEKQSFKSTTQEESEPDINLDDDTLLDKLTKPIEKEVLEIDLSEPYSKTSKTEREFDINTSKVDDMMSKATVNLRSNMDNFDEEDVANFLKFQEFMKRCKTSKVDNFEDILRSVLQNSGLLNNDTPSPPKNKPKPKPKNTDKDTDLSMFAAKPTQSGGKRRTRKDL